MKYKTLYEKKEEDGMLIIKKKQIAKSMVADIIVELDFRGFDLYTLEYSALQETKKKLESVIMKYLYQEFCNILLGVAGSCENYSSGCVNCDNRQHIGYCVQ